MFFVSIFVLFSCTNINQGGNSNVSGKIRNITFAYNSASAISVGTYWSVMILGGSYYPNVSFSFLKSNNPKTYSITTYGTPSGSNEGIQVNGMISSTLGTLFDSGTLIIDSITASSIKGHIVGAVTIEQTSNLDGYFSANIQ